MAGSIIRLAQRERVFIPIRANVDQLVSVATLWAKEKAADLIDLRINVGKHHFQPTISASPHGGLRRVNAHHSAASLNRCRR